MGFFVDCADCDYKEHYLSLFLASQDANNHANAYFHRKVRVYADDESLLYEYSKEQGI